MVRLLKPLDHYQQKYGSWMYGLNKLYLMMEKQHNRGQEGAGLACVKMRAAPGQEFMFRERALGVNAIKEIFAAFSHLPVNSTWVTSDIRPREKAAFLMSIPFCDATTGAPRTSASAPIST